MAQSAPEGLLPLISPRPPRSTRSTRNDPLEQRGPGGANEVLAPAISAIPHIQEQQNLLSLSSLLPSHSQHDGSSDYGVDENRPPAMSAKIEVQKHQRAWLDTEPDWKDRIGVGWQAKRMLGRGGQGMVGHWSYEGPDRDQKSVKDIAVKQAVRDGPNYTWGDGLETEASFLKDFAGSNSPHILRMYSHLFSDIGQGTDDYDEGDVQRLFLEFCQGGDLGRWLKKNGRVHRKRQEEIY